MKSSESLQPTRRRAIVRAVYIAPAVVTLAAAPSFAKAGSIKPPGGGPPFEPPRGRGGPDGPPPFTPRMSG